MKPSLVNFLHRVPLEDFFDHYKQNEPLVITGLGEHLSELMQLPQLKSLDTLIESWPDLINAYLPGVDDEVNSRSFEKQQARELYQTGKGLFFDDPNRFEPVIDNWLQALHRDLGLSNLTYSRSLIYAIAKGQGTAAHFDQNINFVLQISGTKKWWIADNEMVDNPLTRYTIGTDMDPELSSYVSGDVPTEFPENCTELELTPGSVLFLPRGMWHQTLATSDALSLNFTFSAPSWVDLFTGALRARLVQSAAWRETANFVNEQSRCHEAQAHFDVLIDELKVYMQHWQADDILGATEFRAE